MTVLVARLTGPLQSWGAEPKLKTAPTHSTPTWSAIRGLLRAALGHSRTDDPTQVAWLDRFSCAIRVDRPGRSLVDFHTMNPLPEVYEAFAGIGPSDRGIVPLGTTLQAGNGRPARWFKGEVAAITRRYYLQDAAFLLLLEGSVENVARLAAALDTPRWTLSLGRKSCTASSPILLGSGDGSLVDVARAAPVMTRGKRPGFLDLVWLHGNVDPALRVVRTRAVQDIPLGPHPQHGYATNKHTVTRLDLPDVSAISSEDLLTDPAGLRPPRAPETLLDWAVRQLDHPARTLKEVSS